MEAYENTRAVVTRFAARRTRHLVWGPLGTRKWDFANAGPVLVSGADIDEWEAVEGSRICSSEADGSARDPFVCANSYDRISETGLSQGYDLLFCRHE